MVANTLMLYGLVAIIVIAALAHSGFNRHLKTLPNVTQALYRERLRWFTYGWVSVTVFFTIVLLVVR